ncbi:sensor histidine kinase [Microbacteriaceae bacterium VKM Ac-2855]|nr:sensor histidine kinase [Microbacteriaceae bacterium VKM Ac-2855]
MSSTPRWNWWDTAYAAAVVLLVGFTLISEVRVEADRIGGVITVLAIGAAYALLGRSALASGSGRRANPLPFAVALVIGCGAATAFVPNLANAQAIAIPTIWWLIDGRRRGVAGTLAIGGSVIVGYTAGAGWDVGAFFQALSFETLAMVFSIALGLWITGIGEWGEERARLLTELQGAQGALEIASRDAGATAERERIAREIHDTIAQSLTSVVLLAQRGKAELDVDPVRAAETIELIETTARETLGEARALVATSAPVAMGDGGLAEVLRRLATRFTRETGVTVTVRVEADAPRDVQVLLLRAAQEGLANVRKHSGAGTVAIVVGGSNGPGAAESIELVVEDDGTGPVGFTEDAESGFGIAGMRDRVGLVGGSVELGYRDGGGARLRVRVPVQHEAEVAR